MGRGVSSGGGQSSLGYLFGSGEASVAQPAANNVKAPPPQNPDQAVSRVMPEKPSAVAPPVDATKQVPAGIQGSQNTGNFITDRTCTKIHAAPGGGSSLGYLFGGSK